jgi:hypothetical protein
MKTLLLFLALLAARSHAAVPFTVGVDPCQFSAGTPTPAIDPITARARVIVENNCTSCHGKGKTGGAGMFNDILDVNELIKDAWIIPGDAAGSTLFKAVDTDKMPKGPPPKKLSVADKKTLADWINIRKAEDWNATVSPLPAGFVAYEDELACMVYDATKLDQHKRGDARNYEYFQLTPQWNSGDAVRFQNLGMALDIALVSTSINFTKRTAAIHPFNAEKVDPDGVIRRIFAPTANRDIKEDFDIKLLVDGNYPFQINYFNGTYKSRTTRERIKLLEDELARLTGRRQSFVRADFAVNEIYNRNYTAFLGIDKKRQKLQDIEKILGVNAFQQIFDLEVQRSCYKQSGVSLNNRCVDFFESRYTLGGGLTDTTYTRTYDVLNENDRRNFFAFVLGPDGQQFENFKANATNTFLHDAGEAIGINPAGEQIYLVALADGTLIDEADTAIVFNPQNVHPFLGTRAGAITTGVGCRGCHAAGYNTFTDQALAVAKSNGGLSANEFNIIKSIFPEQAVWDANFTAFNTAFAAVHAVYIKDPATLAYAGEPATASVRQFNDYLTVKEAASELNVSESDFQTGCLDKEDAIARALSLTGRYGKVTRAGFIDQFGIIVDKCGYGQQVKFVIKKGGGAKPPVVPPIKKRLDCDYSFQNNSSYRVQFVVDWFVTPALSSSNSFVILPGESSQVFHFGPSDVEGELREFKYATRGPSGWGSTLTSLKGGHISGCRVFEFSDNGSKPSIH